MEEKIKSLLENKAFASKLAACKSAAAVKSLLAASGFNVDIGFCEKLLREGSGELDESSLADVAGGNEGVNHRWHEDR